MFTQELKKLSFHQQWLLIAEEDLRLVKIALREKDCSNVAIFHTQQCAEKALKAFLLFKKQTLEKRHDLVRLIHQCSQFDPLFNVLMRCAERLNPFQTQTRYPDEDFIVVNFAILKVSIDEAEQILNFVKDRIQ